MMSRRHSLIAPVAIVACDIYSRHQRICRQWPHTMAAMIHHVKCLHRKSLKTMADRSAKSVSTRRCFQSLLHVITTRLTDNRQRRALRWTRAMSRLQGASMAVSLVLCCAYGIDHYCSLSTWHRSSLSRFMTAIALK